MSTTVLRTQDIARIVHATGLRPFLERLLATMEADFRRWPEFDKSPRSAAHSASGVIELMPIADATLYAFKYVNGHPLNHLRQLPTVMAFGVLAEVATGLPLLLSEMTLTTALRTAVASVMAARRLARPGSRTMALIGNGAQGEFQALAFHLLMGIDEIRLYDLDAEANAKLIRNLRACPALKLRACASTAEAVRGADIVTTATADKTLATIITPEMLEPGMHVNGVGGDCPGKTELHRGVLERAARVFVEYAPQTRIEGDIQQMPADFPVTELWRVLRGEAPGRSDEREITVFDSVGFALEDFSALRLLRDCALELGLGEPLALVPELDDPKNLFGQLSAEPLRPAKAPVTPRPSVQAA
ncbi:ornithine cyclodeaminase [Paucibacter sp. R3-3]|uniref:Ornithine cyclodeaminase n=1 Tax=Roseateles agri TaxID=3098619 RepID=A0ABU5D9D6_9BURK|nr:ornithine cyclodeaminase [Paucibacter sp. R3-3]MDY0742897.1 ornithine cyclodeaminase [Paucibacter sp. R3-3]